VGSTALSNSWNKGIQVKGTASAQIALRDAWHCIISVLPPIAAEPT
jgi:hypothetical protein